MQKRVLLLTGKPGIGKTTVLMKTVNTLKKKGYTVGGILSCEIRENGKRVGFEILDLKSGRRGWLAHAFQKKGPQVGRYHVNVENLSNIGAQAITEAVKKCHVVVIDEIGPMELFSEKFKEALRKALDSQKLVIAVVHWKVREMRMLKASSRQDFKTITVTFENRDELHKIIVEQAAKILDLSDYTF